MKITSFGPFELEEKVIRMTKLEISRWSWGRVDKVCFLHIFYFHKLFILWVDARGEEDGKRKIFFFL